MEGYEVRIIEDYRGIMSIYLYPQCEHESHIKEIGHLFNDSLFIEDGNHLVTLEVLKAIVTEWEKYKESLKVNPLEE